MLIIYSFEIIFFSFDKRSGSLILVQLSHLSRVKVFLAFTFPKIFRASMPPGPLEGGSFGPTVV